MTQPKVSVLMSVYNGGKYLRLAISSILTQEFRDFEFLIVDDGSSDDSAGLVESFNDPRVRLIRAPHEGLVSSLNLGLSEATGLYVARMDADDIARTDRLAVQVAHLDANQHTGLVCSNIRVIDAEGEVVGVQRDAWPDMASLRDGLLYRRRMKPVIHPSVMMRREVAESIGGYRHFEAAEDRDFWLRALDKYRFDRLEQDLIDYRIHPSGISREKGSRQQVSSAMSAVNWLVQQQTGVDMFAAHSELFTTVARAVRSRIEQEVLPGAIAFLTARSAIRAGDRLAGLVGLTTAVAKYGRVALPDGARIATRRIIDEVVTSACSTVILEAAKWTI